MISLANTNLLKIGQVAQLCGLSVTMIRYYEELGLLCPSVKRAKSGYRLFSESVVKRLDFIKRCQSLGLSLKDIQEILIVHDAGEIPCKVVKEHLLQKLALIQQQIEDLEVLKSELQAILSSWLEVDSIEQTADKICPNINDK